jgi:hypothetical protein
MLQQMVSTRYHTQHPATLMAHHTRCPDQTQTSLMIGTISAQHHNTIHSTQLTPSARITHSNNTIV